jgi:TAT (twin-arginine translocation) pathway signal sequence
MNRRAGREGDGNREITRRHVLKTGLALGAASLTAVATPTPTAAAGGVYGHSRQDKLEIIEEEGILHESKHFPCCLQEKYPCSCP